MATNPMQRKTRNSFLGGMLLTLILTGIVIALLMMQLIKVKEENELEQSSQVTAYMLTSDTKSGTEISYADLELVQVSYINAPSDYISSLSGDAIYAKFNMTSGTILSEDMIYANEEEMNDSLRVQEYNMLVLPMDLETGNIVDIRLSLPSGTEYIVVSHKEVEIPLIGFEYSSDTVIFELSEEEILMMSNAIVEAYQIPGSKLYVNVYTDPGVQEAATVTYVVNDEVKNLIYDNPNIVNEAKVALKEVYDNLQEQRDYVINSDIINAGEQGEANIESGVEESIMNSQAAREDYLDSLMGY